jgi:selenocysteine lyase/cysteine desulfurase
VSYKEHFSEFFSANPDRLHFAAHSHHPWADVTLAAQTQYWKDSVRLVDDKWGLVLGEVIPDTQARIASKLGLSRPESLTFAPNTHSFLLRIFSCLEPPVRILSTKSEFHSFARQSRRWEEAGLAIVDRVDTEPFDSFEDRLLTEIEAGVHDLIYLSSVFFDSGYPVKDMERLVAAVPNDSTFVVIDGYHQFLARPTNLSTIESRAFYLSGGYKYAMAGEGACFLHSPDGFGRRPVDTGWYAGFGQLESRVTTQVPYNSDGSRFAGATYDPSGIYRLRAVLQLLDELELSPEKIHSHVDNLQRRFLESDNRLGELIPGPGEDRGNFLTFRSERAGEHYRSLHDGGVITDYRADRLRLGFGIYHDESDVDRLVELVSKHIR